MFVKNAFFNFIPTRQQAPVKGNQQQQQNTSSNQNNQQPPSSQNNNANNTSNTTSADAQALQNQQKMLNEMPYNNVTMTLKNGVFSFNLADKQSAPAFSIPENISKNDLEKLISNIKWGSPEAAFYPFGKALYKTFDAIDSNGDGKISASELSFMMASTGGITNNTIQFDDFRAMSEMPPIQAFQFGLDRKSGSGGIRMNIRGTDAPIVLPGPLTPDALNKILQETPHTSPYYPVLIKLGLAAFKNGATSVDTTNFIRGIAHLAQTDYSGTITPEMLD